MCANSPTSNFNISPYSLATRFLLPFLIPRDLWFTFSGFTYSGHTHMQYVVIYDWLPSWKDFSNILYLCMCTHIHILTTYRGSKAAPEGSFYPPTVWGQAFLPELPCLPCKSSLFLSVLKIWLYFQTLFVVEIFGFSFMVSTKKPKN